LRILGVDPGEKRIGLAVSDPLGITARGLETVHFEDLELALKRIASICSEYEISRIVVGNPINMNGSCGPAAEKAEKLAILLKEKTGLPVYLHDERLTSGRAEKLLIEGGLRREKRRRVKDKLAAALILESFMASEKNNENGV
jgi:putative Holliday junction resolvase